MNDFYKIITARLVSCFGSILSYIVFNIYILEITHSPVWVGILFAARTLPAIAMSPVIGFLADRFNRKKLMVFSDFILCFSILGMIFIPADFVISYMVFLMICLGILGSLFDVCLKAAIPVILSDQNTLKANSLLHGGINMVEAAGGLLSMFAHMIFNNYSSIFVLDALTYLLSGIILWRLRLKTDAGNRSHVSFMGMLKELKSLFVSPRFRTVSLCLFLLFFDALGSASHNIGFPVFSEFLNPAEPFFYYGLIIFSWALGNIAGIFLVNGSESLKKTRPENLYFFFTGLMSLGMIMVFQTHWLVIISISAFCAGVGDGTYQTFFTTFLQQADDALRGRLFAVSETVLRTGFGLGFIAVPLVLISVPVSKMVLLFHAPVLLIVVFFLVYSRRLGRGPKAPQLSTGSGDQA